MAVESTDFPLAYLITFRTYGSWLRGDERGSVDRSHNIPGASLAPPDAKRVAAMQSRMKSTAEQLSGPQRTCVDQTVREVCQHRGWELHALNARTNHFHVVVATAAAPERVMNDLKAWCTRRLRESGLVGKDSPVWARHGSTKYLWDERAVNNASHYVSEGQEVRFEK